MAERVYRKKSTADVPSASIPDVSATVPKVEMPQQSVVASSSAAGTGQRIFKKKAATSAPQGVTAQPTSRVYSVRPEVKAYRDAKHLQSWGNDVSSLSSDATAYFENINDGNVPSDESYGQMMGRIDTALSSVDKQREAYADNADVAAYIDEVADYLRTVRAEVEKYRGGIEGVLRQEMADRVAAAGDATGKVTTKAAHNVGVQAPTLSLDHLTGMARAENPNWIVKYNAPASRDANLRAMGHDVVAGVSEAGHLMWQGLDWLIPDDEVANLFGVENQFGKIFDMEQQGIESVRAENARLDRYANSTAAAVGNQVIAPVAAALPNLVVAFMSSGASLPAQLSTNSGSALATVATTTAKNPNFWMSFVQSGGAAYEGAIDSGATELEAQAVAWITALPSALVEIGGGIESIPKTQAGIRAFVKNAFEEGGEEMLQGIIEQYARTVVFEHENEWASWTDSDAVLSGSRAAQEFISGVTVAAVLNGGVKATQYAYQSYQYTQLGERFISAEGGVTIDDAIAIGLSNAKGTDAYKAAVKIQEKVKAGETVTPYAVGRMVAESQTEQAQAARAIEREVLESGRRVGYDTEAVEQISQAAVALNLRVRFAAPNEMVNANNAGEYHSDTDTIVLNSAVKNVEMLMGYVMGHETAHSVEGTQQMETLKKLAIRSMGADAWAELQAKIQKDYAAAGTTLSPAEVEKEALADWIGQNLFKKGFVQAVVNGDATTGGTFLYLLDRVRRVFATKNSLSNNVAMLERLFMQAIEARDTRTVTDGEGVQGVIVALEDGKIYVQADRKVLTGTDREAWKGQIDAFFDQVLLRNGSLTVESVEGDELTITKDQTVWKGKDEHVLENGTRRPLRNNEYLVKLTALSHIDELAEASVVQRNKEGKPKTTPDAKNHPFAKDGFEYRTVYFQDFDGKYYRITLSVGLNDGVATVYNVGQVKEAATPEGSIISAIGSKAQGVTATTTTVAQNDSGVNTQSMPNGDGISTEDGESGAQAALLTPDMLLDSRADAAETDTSVGEGEAGTAPTTPQAPAVAAQVDEAAVLDAAIRSAAQGKVTSQATDVEGVIADLGDEEAMRRMYTAAQMHRPTGMVEVDGRRVDAAAYMDAYERSLPDDVAALEATVRELSERRTAEIVRMEQEGTLEDYHFGGLKIDLQLFAAQRKWDLLQLDAGEDGKKARQFYEKRLRGTDANHNQELVDLLAGRSETYNPIADEVTLDRAKGRLRDHKYQEKLISRIGKYDPHDVLTAVDVAAAQVLINDAINEGELEVAADLIAGLSRKGTELGRAVQAFSMMARLTPEGTLRAAIRTVKADADYVVGEGANEGLDVLADDLVRAIREAEEEGLSSDEIADRIRNGEGDETTVRRKKRRPSQNAEQPTASATSDDAQGVEPQGLAVVPDTPTGMRTTPTGEIRPYDKMIPQSDTDSDEGEYHSPRKTERKLSRGELTQLLSENLAEERGNFLSQEEIYDVLWKTVEECTNIPEQLKRYVLKKLRKDDGGLAQRIYELYLRGDLKQVRLRRAMESALELPTLTDSDIEWVVKQGEKIDSLKDKPVEQADAMDELYDFLGAKLSVNRWDWLQAWRKFGMLFNVKTHFRNILSNGAYYGIRKADDAVAMLLERILVRDPSQRGAALGWSHTEHGQSIMPLLQEQAELAVLEMQKRGAKYETGTGQLKQRRKFFGLSKFGEMLNSANRWNSEWLEREDIWFFRPTYIDALGQIMTARGATEVTPELHQLAMQRALEATFRADNMISDVISALKRFQNESTTGKRLFGHAADVVIPFHKTPANLAAQAVWHSPIGIVKGVFDLCNATRGKGSKDVATAINTMAKGVTGSVLLVIGLVLGSAGLFNTGFGKTEKERAADEMAGLQDGAFVVNGVSVSLDWLQPAASPLIVGASIAERLKSEGLTLNSIAGAVMDGTDSLFELTMLQSLYDILGGYDAGASGTMMSVGENVVSQSVPTLLGQLARAIDPVQRKTKGDTEFETIINQVVAKIPGLTYLLDPELDVWGNVVYRTGKPSAGTAVLNAGQQFIIPANTKVGTGFGDPISQEILRLYEVEGGAVIPSAASRDDAKEAGVDYVDVNRLLGGVNRLAVEEFIGNEKPYDVMVETGELTAAGNPKTKKVTKYYRDMTDEERRKVLARIYKDSKKTVLEPDEGGGNESEQYFRDLIRRVRGGERGTFTAAEEQPAAKQESTSYFDDLIRRMRNGN